MKFSQETRNGISITYLRGELDLQTIREFNKLFEDYREHMINRIILDLGEVTFIDSQSLATIINQSTHMRKQGGDIKLTRVPENILRMFELVRMKDVLDFLPDIEQALKAF